MRKFIYLLCVGLLLTGCDDGDVLSVELDFDDTFNSCGELVFYKTKTDPAESLSIFINNLDIEDITKTVYRDTDSVFVDLVSPSLSVTLDGNTNKINYRTYTSLPSTPFCSDVPASNLNIVKDAVGTGTAIITTTLTEDDNDGIPAEFEDLNNNGDLTDDDTDGDGVPNYLDDDDDGDNVKTINEKVNFDQASDLTNALDTDMDGIPNYLDNDDDGDGVPTRNEQNFTPNDQNPGNDVTNSAVGPDYLNPDVKDSTLETKYSAHNIKETYAIRIVINNLSIPQLSQDVLDFGTLNDGSITSGARSVKTKFN